jgi:hypothetical protein
MNNTFDASKLLTTLSEQESSKRHADEQDTSTKDTLPMVNNPDVIAWLRSLAPLTNQELYDSNWKD